MHLLLRPELLLLFLGLNVCLRLYSLASGATNFCELNRLPAELTKHIRYGLRYFRAGRLVDLGRGVELDGRELVLVLERGPRVELASRLVLVLLPPMVVVATVAVFVVVVVGFLVEVGLGEVLVLLVGALLEGACVAYLGLPEQQHRSPNESLDESRRNMHPFRA